LRQSRAARRLGGRRYAILNNAEATANMTRAAIRLPLVGRVIAWRTSNGTIIGLRRMQDSTVFSIDVAATKRATWLTSIVLFEPLRI